MWSLYLYSQFNNYDYEIVWYYIILMEYVLDNGDGVHFFLRSDLNIFLVSTFTCRTTLNLLFYLFLGHNPTYRQI